MAAWLKAFGVADAPLESNWTESPGSNRLLRMATFGRNPGSIKIGDKLVYYALGHRKVFAIAEVIGSPNNAGPQAAPWPYYCDVDIIAIRASIDNAFPIDQFNAGRDLKKTMIRRSHIKLEDNEYASIVAAFVDLLREDDKKFAAVEV